MNVGFRLNENGGYDRLFRLNELEIGDIFKLRLENGTFIRDYKLETLHFVCLKQAQLVGANDFRYFVDSLPLLFAWAIIEKIKQYFQEHFSYTNYAIAPNDLNRLCYSDDYKNWKIEKFPMFINEFRSKEKIELVSRWFDYAAPAMEIDNVDYANRDKLKESHDVKWPFPKS